IMNEVVQAHEETKAKKALLNDSLPPFVWGGVGLLMLIGLFAVGRHDFILFHCMAELFSIAVAWAVFLLVWNARAFIKNDALLFLGVAYLFIGFVDLLHTLAYKGMNVFDPHWGANLPTQLWIAARFMEGAALFAVAVLLGRRVKLTLSLVIWFAVTTLMLLVIFYWRVFPVCYMERTGLTAFKMTSEYMICLLLLSALAVLYKKRDLLDAVVYRLLALSMLLAIASELAFTLYMDVYGYANMVGHLLKVISYMLIYLALIHIGLKRPFALLAADLEREKRELRKSESLLQKIFDTLPIGLWFADKTGKLLRGNPAGVKIWGAEPLVDPSEYGVFKALRIPSGEEITSDNWALARTIRDKTTIVDE
ncbi:MAG: hypothetical protein EOM20_21880, partial [Spartobacteria bacterium]|nr:hypothetical protein [Spartobacteria bacterium]